MLRKVVSEQRHGHRRRGHGLRGGGQDRHRREDRPHRPGEYYQRLYTASFVGYAPAENPQLLVAVVVDEPTAGSYYGGDVAAPAFERHRRVFPAKAENPARLSVPGLLW